MMPPRSVIAAIIFIRPSHAGHFSASTPLYPPQQPRPVDARPLRRRLPPARRGSAPAVSAAEGHRRTHEPARQHTAAHEGLELRDDVERKRSTALLDALGERGEVIAHQPVDDPVAGRWIIPTLQGSPLGGERLRPNPDPQALQELMVDLILGSARDASSMRLTVAKRRGYRDASSMRPRGIGGFTGPGSTGLGLGAQGRCDALS